MDAFHDLSHHDVDTNDLCKSCDVRYLSGGMRKAWAQNKKEIDGGEFDYGARSAALAIVKEKVDR